ncbi:carboxymuconolactone decarboxylase family protein [Paenibacillus macerans]|uniref:carboxymuconolactone decarboxylase family protein n=1 Tax=Paenibacillus macerans TaxID=44252 RepID=UPI003D32447D
MEVSNSYTAFAQEAPEQHNAWQDMVQTMGAASPLDPKTKALAYLSVLATARLHSGIPFHVLQAKQSGASKDEVIGSILLALPAAGMAVLQALPIALSAFGED